MRAVFVIAVALVACQEAPPPTSPPVLDDESVRAEPKQTDEPPASTAQAPEVSPPEAPEVSAEPPQSEPSPEALLASFNTALEAKDYAIAVKLLEDGKIAASLLQRDSKAFAELEKEAKASERKKAWDDAINIRLVLRGVGGPPQAGVIMELEKKRDVAAADQAIEVATKAERWFDVIDHLRKLEGLTRKLKDKEIKRALERLLKPSMSIKVHFGVRALFSSVNWRARKWTFDRHDQSWYEEQAERGHDYVTADFTIEADSKNPRLPRLVVFRVMGREFHPLSRFETRFYRWSSFGAYLGNHGDPSNDFAYSKRVRFTAAPRSRHTSPRCSSSQPAMSSAWLGRTIAGGVRQFLIEIDVTRSVSRAPTISSKNTRSCRSGSPLFLARAVVALPLHHSAT